MHVEQTLHNDGHFDTPKTAASRRSIRLTDGLAELFEQLIRRRRRSDLVFSAPNRGPWNANNLRSRFWYPAIHAAQQCPDHPSPPPPDRRHKTGTSTCDCATYLYQRPRFHDLRHSHVAFLIDAAWDFYAIQQRLGHASIKTTFDIYGHLLPYGDEQHLSRLELRLPATACRPETKHVGDRL
ncbi:tyrosine-type recombinase/integrase [Krasilnikovia sp. MM14-A1004]|uniref:tyrosine-type recombinase/integrase n=1 Tax=Krasilnikovia sp. MM14-A1004 TaxID=3373541 RepID=UPI00399D16DA